MKERNIKFKICDIDIQTARVNGIDFEALCFRGLAVSYTEVGEDFRQINSGTYCEISSYTHNVKQTMSTMSEIVVNAGAYPKIYFDVKLKDFEEFSILKYNKYKGLTANILASLFIAVLNSNALPHMTRFRGSQDKMNEYFAVITDDETGCQYVALANLSAIRR